MWAVFLCRGRLVLDGLFHNILLFSNEGWIFISMQGPVSWVCPTAVVVVSAGEAVVVYFAATPVWGLALFILRISFEISFRIRDLPEKIFSRKKYIVSWFRWFCFVSRGWNHFSSWGISNTIEDRSRIREKLRYREDTSTLFLLTASKMWTIPSSWPGNTLTLEDQNLITRAWS